MRTIPYCTGVRAPVQAATRLWRLFLGDFQKLPGCGPGSSAVGFLAWAGIGAGGPRGPSLQPQTSCQSMKRTTGWESNSLFLCYLSPKYCLMHAWATFYKFPYIRKQTYAKISLCLMRHLNTAFLLRSWEVSASFSVLKFLPIICAKNLVLIS